MRMTHYSTPNVVAFLDAQCPYWPSLLLLKSARLETTPQGSNSINTLASPTDVVREKCLRRDFLVLENPEIAARIAKLSVDGQNKRREGRQFKAIANFKDAFAKTAGNVFKWPLAFALLDSHILTVS
jgi:hypothetical protein